MPHTLIEAEKNLSKEEKEWSLFLLQGIKTLFTEQNKETDLFRILPKLENVQLDESLIFDTSWTQWADEVEDCDGEKETSRHKEVAERRTIAKYEAYKKKHYNYVH
jgi:hypothetical protein